MASFALHFSTVKASAVVHRAGCRHTNLKGTVTELEGTTREAALAEANEIVAENEMKAGLAPCTAPTWGD